MIFLLISSFAIIIITYTKAISKVYLKVKITYYEILTELVKKITYNHTFLKNKAFNKKNLLKLWIQINSKQ